MDDTILSEINQLFYILGALFYLLFIRYIDRRGAKKRSLSDEEYLTKLSRVKRCSEYDIFCFAAGEWNISSKQKIESDFREYLLRGHIPYYVKDYLRKARKTDDYCRPPFLPGSGFLP